MNIQDIIERPEVLVQLEQESVMEEVMVVFSRCIYTYGIYCSTSRSRYLPGG